MDSVEKINQFLDAGGTLVFVLRQDIEGTVAIPAGADVTISGEHKFTGQISCAIAEDAAKTTRLTLDDLTLDGGESTRVAVISQEQNKETVSGLDLTMTGCTVQNYTDKAVYLTNATSLSIDNSTFTNNATGDMDDPNTKGDYTIDLNLVSVDAGELKITNSSFNGTCGAKAQAWAVENGVSDGTDAMGAITREQLVTMLWRLNGEPVVNYLITAPDAENISDWALEAMRWAASEGIIEGNETGALTPKAASTRAQAAAFIVRYLAAK